MRVQSIIRELRGEKIDIIEHSEDPVVFATHALSPAKIARVTLLDSTARHLEVIVEDSQLSLAIGKKGQNVRLAAKLMGWRVDIKTEEENAEVERRWRPWWYRAPVRLIDHGLRRTGHGLVVVAMTVEKLGSMTPEEIEQIAGIEPGIRADPDHVIAYYGQFQTFRRRPAKRGTGRRAEQSSGEVPETKAEANGWRGLSWPIRVCRAENSTDPAGEGSPESESGRDNGFQLKENCGFAQVQCVTMRRSD
jgi:N utilization substance protein A